MTAPLRLPAKKAREWLRYLDDPDDFDGMAILLEGLEEWLRSALAASKPKRSVKAARARKAARDAQEDAEWEAIKAKVFERANGRCEHCGWAGPLEPDHAFQGSDRKTLQSKYTVWALCRTNHEARQLNMPSRAFWLEAFISHADDQAYRARNAGRDADGDGYEAAADIARTRLDSLRLKQSLPHGRTAQ